MGQVGKGAFRAWICLSIGGQWGGWNEAGVVGAAEQEERAEVGLEACMHQRMKGALSEVRNYTLYPKNKDI